MKKARKRKREKSFEISRLLFSCGPNLIAKHGRGRRTRTRDPRFWRPVLYQLSYTPVQRRYYITKKAKMQVFFEKKEDFYCSATIDVRLRERKKGKGIEKVIEI